MIEIACGVVLIVTIVIFLETLSIRHDRKRMEEELEELKRRRGG